MAATSTPAALHRRNSAAWVPLLSPREMKAWELAASFLSAAAELRLWKAAGVDVAATKPAAYRECGCGMGPALNMASSTNAYVLADRGTWLSFKNRGDLTIVVEGDKTLFDQYGVMVVNPAKHPHVKAAAAQRFADWVVSPTGQSTIASYKIGGEQLFFANARP